MSTVWHQALGNIALEEQADGKLHKEIEFDFYAILTDWSELSKASSMVHQEQWVMGAPKPADGSKGFLRVRKIVEGFGGLPKYVFAIKNKTDKVEVEHEVTSDMFDQFVRLSSEGQMKDRYFFPVAGTALVYEVDCFILPEVQPLRRKGHNNRGPQYYPWVKIDLEVPSKATPVPPFPFEVQQVIMEPFGSRKPEDEKIVGGLYKKHYVAANPFTK